ncbi:MAG: branched-chain amino acid ABC transporter permease [Actinomycetota bacterium]
MQLLILGAGTGAVYGLLAVGLVLIYRTTRIVNFAHGAVAMLTGFVTWSLVHDLGVHYATAILLSLEVAAVVGLVVDRGLMRFVRHRSRLSAVIMTVALGLLLQALVLLGWSTQQLYRLEPVFIRRQVEIFGTPVSTESLALMASALVLVAFLAALLRFRPQGLALRAVAESRETAELVGINSAATGTLAWVLGTAVAGIAGVLISPTIVMDAYQIPALMVKALAAALLGRLTSFGWALAGGIGIGVLEARLPEVVSRPGAADVGVFVVIVGFLAVRSGRDASLRLEEDLAR